MYRVDNCSNILVLQTFYVIFIKIMNKIFKKVLFFIDKRMMK